MIITYTVLGVPSYNSNSSYIAPSGLFRNFTSSGSQGLFRSCMCNAPLQLFMLAVVVGQIWVLGLICSRNLVRKVVSDHINYCALNPKP